MFNYKQSVVSKDEMMQTLETWVEFYILSKYGHKWHKVKLSNTFSAMQATANAQTMMDTLKYTTQGVMELGYVVLPLEGKAQKIAFIAVADKPIDSIGFVEEETDQEDIDADAEADADEQEKARDQFRGRRVTSGQPSLRAKIGADGRYQGYDEVKSR